ncbi:MAG: hypothetical protein HY782_22670 [Chloroflexi bacterium]|nr:hypothetical protein [Chloroflexota bacterium]
MRQRMRVFALIAVGLALLVWARPAAASNPISIVLSNVRDTSFVVSWLTGVNEVGKVQLTTGATFNDERGADYAGATHYVVVTGVPSKTTVQFDILSGDSKYTNEGAHYAVTTGTTLSPPPPDLIVGRVRNPDGSNATETILIFTIQHEQGSSAPLSMLLTPKDAGFFHVNLGDARGAQDPTRYFTYGTQTDVLTIQAVNARGTGTIRIPVGDPRLRASDPNQTIVVELSAGGQQPTLVERQATPTPFPATTPQETGVLVVGLGAALFVVIGIIVVAFMFVWRR